MVKGRPCRRPFHFFLRQRRNPDRGSFLPAPVTAALPAVVMVVRLPVERLRVPVMAVMPMTMPARAVKARRTAVMMAADVDLVGFDGRRGRSRCDARGYRRGRNRQSDRAGGGNRKDKRLQHCFSSRSLFPARYGCGPIRQELPLRSERTLRRPFTTRSATRHISGLSFARP